MSPTLDLDISVPRSIDNLDIPSTVIIDIFLRQTFTEDTVTISRLSTALGLNGSILYDIFEQLRARKLLDVKTMQGNDYVFSLTDQGREFAKEAMLKSQYTGVVPVALSSYVAAVKLQKSSLKVNQASMAVAMSDLVVAPEMLDELGPAFNSQHSLFFYGPAGTGKTSLAERLIRLYTDWIVVPRCVLVDGQYMVVFDPTLHEPIEPQPDGLDPRWVACKRPLVTVGGELEASALQLMFDPVGRVYTAPLHVKANNGMMLIDDFGRQVLTPQQLLNRWIYPLSKRMDYLGLANGTKIGIPFELMVAFSTNMAPEDLGDEAFFRRIQNKVYVGPVTAEMFDRILFIVAEKLEMRLTDSSAFRVRQLCLERDAIGLRANYPYDLCKMAKSIAEYEGREAALDEHLLARAARLYWGASNAVMSAAALTASTTGPKKAASAEPATAMRRPPEAPSNEQLMEMVAGD
jgi:predicted transcriptional regulator